MPSWMNKTSRTENDHEIPGTFLHAFINNGGIYYLTDIKIYQDGMVDCWGLVDFDEFKRKVAQGWVVTSLPENATVAVSLLTQFKVEQVKAFVSEDEFIKDVLDEIEELNGRPTSLAKCKEAYERFQEEQSETARQVLKETYEAVPVHKRPFVLRDQDIKDIPIRMIIYGEDEIEKWSHRIVARQQGVEPLPSIEVQGALKRKDQSS